MPAGSGRRRSYLMYSLSQPWYPACRLLWGCTQPMLADFPKEPLLHKGLQSSSCGPGSSHAFKCRNCGSTFEVSEDPQYLEARRNPICHFGVSWYFCAFSSTDCSHSLWTMSLYRCAQCPPGGLFVTVLGVPWMHHLSLIPIHVATMSLVSLLRVM